jgi:membrane protease YdiL (CAAX protease family)
VRPANQQDQLIDFGLLAGVLLLLLMQLMAREAPSQDAVTPPKPSIALIRPIEERGLVIDGSAEVEDTTRSAVDPEGRATSPKRMLEDARDGLLRASTTLPEQHLVWAAVAVALHEDRIALEAVADLARNPVHLGRFEGVLDELNRLGRGQAAKDLLALNTFYKDLGTTGWLEARLRARHLANTGMALESEAAITEARRIADDFVGGQLVVISLQLGLMLVGLATVVMFPLFLRRRAILRGRGGLERTTSPFRLDRSRRVLIGWLLFTWFFQLCLAWARPYLGGLGGGVAAIQLVATTVNLVLAVLLVRGWGMPERSSNTPPPALAETLRLSPRQMAGGWRAFAAWLVPGIGVAVVSLQVAAVFSAFIFGPPDTFQESVQFLMSGASTTDFILVGIGAVVMAPLAEEILFRGFLYRNLRDNLGRPWAIVASGLIFGAVHMHPQFILPLAGLGAGLALLYEWTGSLWLPIIAHAAWNALTLYQVHATFNV